jgi:hypothetical protein
MRRREVIALVAGSAAGQSAGHGHAQQQPKRVGILLQGGPHHWKNQRAKPNLQPMKHCSREMVIAARNLQVSRVFDRAECGCELVTPALDPEHIGDQVLAYLDKC